MKSLLFQFTRIVDKAGRPHNLDFLLRGAVLATIRIIGLASVFALQVLLARLLGDSAEYGKYAWGQSLLFVLGTIAAMGIPAATGRFIAALEAQNNEPLIHRVTAKALKIAALTSALLVLAAVLLSMVWRVGENSDQYRNTSLLAFVLAPTVTFFLLYQFMAQARRWILLAFLPSQILKPALTGILIFMVWWLRGEELSGETALFLTALSILMVTIPQSVIYHRRQKQLPHETTAPEPGDEFHPEKLLSTALPIFFTRIAALVIEYSNILLLGILAGPIVAGLYFAADRLARLASIPLSLVESLSQPAYSAAQATGNINRLQQAATQAAHGSLWPTLLVGLFLIVFGEPILTIFGEDFTAALPVLVILLIGQLINVSTGTGRHLLIMTGHQAYVPRVMIYAALVHICALLILLPPFGAIGAAFTAVLSSVISNVWMMILVKRVMAIRPTVLASLTRKQ